MIKVSHRVLIFIAGAVWLIIGIFLLTLGINLILNSFLIPLKNPSLIALFQKLFTKDKTHAALLLLTLGIFVGYLKAKFVFKKAVSKQVVRITGLSNPAPLTSLYSKGYYCLILFMMGLGICLRFLPFSQDIRGTVDVVVGSALIQGACHYFRFATTSYKELL